MSVDSVRSVSGSVVWPIPGAASAVLRGVGRRLLLVYVVILFLIPSDEVISPLGASGYVASVVAMGLFGVAAALVVRGVERPRNPLRSVLFLLWLVTLASYLSFHLAAQDPAETYAADRWVLLLMEVTGVILVTGWCLTRVDHVTTLLRTLAWAGAFCGLVAGLQFWFAWDLTPVLREVPGLVQHGDEFGIQLRGSLNRVAGTAIHPIELGTTTAMLLPFALHLVLFDRVRPLWRRLLPCLLVAFGIPASVSRSAVLAVAVSLGIYVLCLPASRRVLCLGLAPVAVSAVFVSAPGLIGTLLSFFRAGTSDPSIRSRVGDYPLVESRVLEHPLFGAGGGTFIPQNAFEVLDNQYLKAAIEVGLVGLVVLVAYLVVPFVVALRARRQVGDPVMASVSSACAGATAAAVTCLFAFDGFSFPMFTGVHAVVLGLCGVCGLVARARLTSGSADQEERFMRHRGQAESSPGGGSGVDGDRRVAVFADGNGMKEA
jgi:O-antigen ligase